MMRFGFSYSFVLCGPSSSESTSNPAQQTLTGQSMGTTGTSSPLATGQSLAAGGNLTVSSDPAVIKDALDTVRAEIDNALKSVGTVATNTSATLSDLVKAAQDTADSQGTAQQATLTQVLQNEMDLAKSVQSQGQTEQNKTILYIAGGAAALLLAVMALNKKS